MVILALVLAIMVAGLTACGPETAPIGTFEAVYRAGNGNVTVIGWAGYPKTSRAVSVVVAVNGHNVITTKASVNRPDVGATQPGLGAAHGFGIILPGGSATVGTVCVTAIDPVTKSVKALGCKAIPALPAPTPAPEPPWAGPPENVVFSYENPSDTAYAASLGHPKWVVSTYDTGAALAHAAGAKAFRYTQFTWFPSTGEWLGPMFNTRAAWECNLPGEPRKGDTWYYANQNLVGFTNAAIAYARNVKALGFDGIFLDVSGRALGGPPSQVTCATPAGQQNVGPVLTTREAYLRLVKTIHDTTGLQVALNNPGADIVPRVRNWATFWLRENAVNSGMTPGLAALATMQADARAGGSQLVEMVKSKKRSTDPLKSAEETFVWAFAKLSGEPVVMNTGYDECRTGVNGEIEADVDGCNRMGATPDLINVSLGQGIGQVEMQGTVALRRYEHGFVVVNIAPVGTANAGVRFQLSRCRVLYRQRAGFLNDGKCVQDVNLSVGAQRGWIVTYR